MVSKQTLRVTSQAFVIAKFMSEFHAAVGTEAYLNSPVRTHHVTGNSWFGINSLGDNDCLARQFRNITDSLGQSYKDWDNIEFVSESCLNITNRSKKIHVVEHTREVITFVKQFEEEYIIGGKPFTAATIATNLILNQIVTFVEKSEQLTAYHSDNNKPFSKYDARIFYRGTDVSDYSLDELLKINADRYSDILSEINNFDFKELIATHTQKLVGQVGKHTIPELEVAVKYHNDMFMLLNKHYHHKLKKVINPNNKTWYNVKLASEYTDWLENKVKEQSI
jgi:hypothetical protein